MLREWQINYRNDDGIMQQKTVKKVSWQDAHRAACEMLPNNEIVAIVEGDIVIESE